MGRSREIKGRSGESAEEAKGEVAVKRRVSMRSADLPVSGSSAGTQGSRAASEARGAWFEAATPTRVAVKERLARRLEGGGGWDGRALCRLARGGTRPPRRLHEEEDGLTCAVTRGEHALEVPTRYGEIWGDMGRSRGARARGTYEYGSEKGGRVGEGWWCEVCRGGGVKNAVGVV